MSTKGASNRYGNSRGSNHGHPTAHIGYAWARAFNKATLDQHFYDHGKQMGCPTKESYEAHAVSFANTVDRKNCESFVAANGSTYKFNRKTEEFAIITKKGIVITYFKPKDGREYYLSQIGGKINGKKK